MAKEKARREAAIAEHIRQEELALQERNRKREEARLEKEARIAQQIKERTAALEADMAREEVRTFWQQRQRRARPGGEWGQKGSGGRAGGGWPGMANEKTHAAGSAQVGGGCCARRPSGTTRGGASVTLVFFSSRLAWLWPSSVAASACYSAFLEAHD